MVQSAQVSLSFPIKLSLSPTKVDTFFGCRRLFFYNYISKPFTPKENKYFLIGNVVHKVLEGFHKNAKNLDGDFKEIFKGLFKNAIEVYHVRDKIKSGLITEDDAISMRNMIKGYITYLRSLEEPPNVFMVEKLHKISIGGEVCWLKSDRIDKVGDNFYKVVDYKTGKPAKREDELDSVQIPSYGILIRKLVDPKAKIIGEYQYVKFLGTKNGVHFHEITEDMMKKAEEKYAKVKTLLAEGCAFPQNFGYKYCRICDYRNYCLKDNRKFLETEIQKKSED
jgi:CRISPR/Cas system-associated exonuclease Cas4 (RecB family)